MLALPACSGNPQVVTTPPASTLPLPSRPPSSVPADVLRQIVEAYADRKRWLRRLRHGVEIQDEENRHKAFFVRRRTLYLCDRNPGWSSEPGWGSLFARLDAEHDAVLSFVDAKRGTRAAPGPLGGAADANPHPHLDLSDLARVKTTTPARVAARRRRHYVRLRRYRVAAIAWRAAAVHNELWPASPALETAALAQLVDHRLRIVERMNFQVASAAALVDRHERAEALRFDAGGNPDGPWHDGFRIRMFEYPRVPAARAGVIGASRISEWNEVAFQPAKTWQWENERHRRLHYNVDGPPGIRFAPQSAGDWSKDSNLAVYYRRYLTPAAGTAGAAMDRLFLAKEDWWERSWLFCDHVVSALQIEGLLLAIRRREGADTAFDALPARHAPSYIAVNATLNVDANIDLDALIADGADDPYFEKTRVFEDDLQIGDHLIVWNSFLYAQISRGEWQLENSIVIDVDVDPLSGNASRQRLRLQGHGIGAKRYTDYLDEIAGQVRGTLRDIRAAVRSNPAGPFLRWNGADNRLMRWDPYEPFPDPGAWWITLPVPDTSSRRFWQTEDEARRMLVKAVSNQTAVGPGYHVPPFPGPAVFFPVFEPYMRDRTHGGPNGGWAEYFDRRRAGPLSRAPRLVNVRIEGDLMPGLFYRGMGTPIAVNRPRVKP